MHRPLQAPSQLATSRTHLRWRVDVGRLEQLLDTLDDLCVRMLAGGKVTATTTLSGPGLAPHHGPAPTEAPFAVSIIAAHRPPGAAARTPP